MSVMRSSKILLDFSISVNLADKKFRRSYIQEATLSLSLRQSEPAYFRAYLCDQHKILRF